MLQCVIARCEPWKWRNRYFMPVVCQMQCISINCMWAIAILVMWTLRFFIACCMCIRNSLRCLCLTVMSASCHCKWVLLSLVTSVLSCIIMSRHCRMWQGYSFISYRSIKVVVFVVECVYFRAMQDNVPHLWQTKTQYNVYWNCSAELKLTCNGLKHLLQLFTVGSHCCF